MIGSRPRPRSADKAEVAVALHDVEPATFERVALMRDWLADHEITRVTLLVVPARDLHSLADRSGELVEWLIERREAGDAIAQNGFTGRCPPFAPRDRLRGEFAALDGDETRRAVEAGWRILRLAGIEPRGFVAPAYEYTPALHAVLPRRFSWWLGASRIYAAGGPPGGTALTPSLTLGSSGLRRVVRPWLPGARSLADRPRLRLDLDPSDLDRPRRIAVAEGLLRAAHGRRAITIDDLAPPVPAATATGRGVAAARSASGASGTASGSR